MSFSRYVGLLLLSFALVCSSWAAFGAFRGATFSAFALVLAVRIATGKSTWRRTLRNWAIVLGFFVLVCLLLPAVDLAREAAHCNQCRNNLDQIAVALQCYRNGRGTYPPTSICDKKGRPLHSWRLVILPGLDTSQMYDSCDFKEPWSSPRNKKALSTPMSVYRCPSDPAVGAAPNSLATSYVAIVGWNDSAGQAEKADQEQGDSQPRTTDTFLIAEMTNSRIQWMEPKDVCFTDAAAMRSLVANGPHRQDNGYFFRPTRRAHVLLADGYEIYLSRGDASPNAFATLFPLDSREKDARHCRDNPLYPLYQEEPQIHWPHAIGLPTWIVAVGLMFLLAVRHRKSLARTEEVELPSG